MPRRRHAVAKFCDAYDTRTGDKLPHQVPEQHFEIFPDAISREPVTFATGGVVEQPADAVFVQEPQPSRIPTTRTPRAATTEPAPSAEKE
jgi:hypothetical protein